MLKIPSNMTEIQVRAYKECSDLILNGYIVLFSAITPTSWIVKFRHKRNCRVLTMRCSKADWFLADSGVVLKSESISSDV